jgi:hypothetical protein
VALLSIAEKNHRRGSALYGGEAAFSTALIEALSLGEASGEDALVLCGDETLPEDWHPLVPRAVPPHALGLLVAPGPGPDRVSLLVESGTPQAFGASSGQGSQSAAGLAQPLAFLAWFLGPRDTPLVLAHRGFALRLSGRV